MQTYVKEIWDSHRVYGIRGDTGTYVPTSSESALLRVASARFEAFRERFGREPLLDEPLFFDPEADSPVPASAVQMSAQLAEACRKTGVAPSMLTNFWSLAQDDAV